MQGLMGMQETRDLLEIVVPKELREKKVIKDQLVDQGKEEKMMVLKVLKMELVLHKREYLVTQDLEDFQVKWGHVVQMVSEANRVSRDSKERLALRVPQVSKALMVIQAYLVLMVKLVTMVSQVNLVLLDPQEQLGHQVFLEKLGSRVKEVLED